MSEDYFDVRIHTTKPEPLPDSVATRSINLMCALLNGITYRELYDQTFHDDSGNSVLDRLITNANNLHADLRVDALGDPFPVHDILAGDAGVFVQIRTVLESTGLQRFKLKELFYTDIYEGITTRNKVLFQVIVGLLEKVHTPAEDSNTDRMYHFCVPFLTVQKGRIPNNLARRKFKPTKDDLDYFVDHLGHLEMKDFYQAYNENGDEGERNQKPTYAELRDVAKRALDHCIFKEHNRPNGPIIVRGTYGNSEFCTGSDAGCDGCTHEDDWCNDFEYEPNKKRCSLGSDYH